MSSDKIGNGKYGFNSSADYVNVMFPFIATCRCLYLYLPELFTLIITSMIYDLKSLHHCVGPRTWYKISSWYHLPPGVNISQQNYIIKWKNYRIIAILLKVSKYLPHSSLQ